MIKLEKTETMNFEGAIRGMRNPMDSWEQSDSYHGGNEYERFIIGPKDLELAKKLVKTGSDHSKFMRQIFVSMDITAPRLWWTEMDTYKIGTTANSESTMLTIHKKPFSIGMFSVDKIVPKHKVPQIEVPCDIEQEVWVPIKGYENKYLISNTCKIQTLPHKIRDANNITREFKGNIKENFAINSAGYKKYVLYSKGGHKNVYIHRLMAEHFVPNIDNKPEVNHKDGNKLNNNVSNLEWVTISENSLHSFEIGTRTVTKYNKFQREVIKRFSQSTVDDIKCLFESGVTKQEISNLYNCSSSLIVDMLNGVSYNPIDLTSFDILKITIDKLNSLREEYLKTKDKETWYQIIQLLPQSFNQMRTWTANYAVLRNIYFARKNHKLDEWREFCKVIESLPYSELITLEK